MSDDSPVFFVGVDAGGSHTEAVIVNQVRAVLARVRGPAGAVGDRTVAASSGRIARTAVDARGAAGLTGIAEALVVGAAGAGTRDVQGALQKELRKLGVAREVLVTTDAAITLESAFPSQAGIVLSAGSGSIAYGRNAAGEVFRAGGLGWQVGDEGSGYAIARAALAAVGRAVDGRGPSTALEDILPKAAGVSNPRDLLRWANDAGRGDVAQLAAAVQTSASNGDDTARDIVQEAAHELAALVTWLLPKVSGDAPVRLALAGGVLTHDSPVRVGVLDALAAQAHPVLVVEDTPDPALGAAAMAVAHRGVR